MSCFLHLKWKKNLLMLLTRYVFVKRIMNHTVKFTMKDDLRQFSHVTTFVLISLPLKRLLYILCCSRLI